MSEPTIAPLSDPTPIDPDALLEREFLASLDRRIPRGVARPITAATFRAAALEALRDATHLALLHAGELAEESVERFSLRVFARAE